MARDPFARRWQTLEVLQAMETVSAEKAQEIIRAVGLGEPSFPSWLVSTQGLDPDEGLARWLNFAAYNLRSEEAKQSAISRDEISARAERASALASELLSILQPDGTLASDFGPGSLWAFAAKDRNGEGGSESVGQAMLGLGNLAAWLSSDAERKANQAAKRQAPLKRRGRRKDIAAHRLMDELSTIFGVAWDRKPGLTRNPLTGALGGPFFRFVSIAFPLIIGEHRDDEALASLFSRAV